MLVVVRGAGDIASGIALRLHTAGFGVVMLECAVPTSIRRTVSFSEAVRLGQTQVEDVRGVRARTCEEALRVVAAGDIAVLVDPEAASVGALRPDAVVDAILAKRNVGTTIDMAAVVVGVGPGFTAGFDCHAAVETQRGHDLGRVLREGSPAPDTGVPGNIGGYTVERVMRAPAAGEFNPVRRIGDAVCAGEVVALVDGVPVKSAIDGVLRGILQEGVVVFEGMKVADVDPRCERAHCTSASDKARAIGGGVLEAILHFSNWQGW